MRVLSVVPRYAVTVGSLKARRGGTVIGKTREERGNCIYSSRRSTLVEEEQKPERERGGTSNLEFTPFNSCRGRNKKEPANIYRSVHGRT